MSTWYTPKAKYHKGDEVYLNISIDGNDRRTTGIIEDVQYMYGIKKYHYLLRYTHPDTNLYHITGSYGKEIVGLVE